VAVDVGRLDCAYEVRPAVGARDDKGNDFVSHGDAPYWVAAGWDQMRLKPRPRSLRLTYLWPAMTRWSTTSMSSSLPASTICSVTRTSSGLGVGSLEGWL